MNPNLQNILHNITTRLEALEGDKAKQEKGEPVAIVDANDDGYWANILPDRNVKVGQLLYTTQQQRKPLQLWTEAQHERAYRNSPELHKDVKSLEAFKRVAKAIAAMYDIKE